MAGQKAHEKLLELLVSTDATTTKFSDDDWHHTLHDEVRPLRRPQWWQVAGELRRVEVRLRIC